MSYPILDESFENITKAEYSKVRRELVAHRPKTDSDRLDRVIYAHLSVRQTCKASTNSYRYIKDNATANSFDDLESSRNMITAPGTGTGTGMTNIRATGLLVTHQTHKENSKFLSKRKNESWVDCRSRWNGQLFGISLSKISFALEMIYPLTARVVCLDSHILKQFGHVGPAPKKRVYQEYEQYFLDLCDQYGYLPAVAREVIWRKSVLHDNANDRYANTWLIDSFGVSAEEAPAETTQQ